jgi:hypothetical protein
MSSSCETTEAMGRQGVCGLAVTEEDEVASTVSPLSLSSSLQDAERWKPRSGFMPNKDDLEDCLERRLSIVSVNLNGLSVDAAALFVNINDVSVGGSCSNCAPTPAVSFATSRGRAPFARTGAGVLPMGFGSSITLGFSIFRTAFARMNRLCVDKIGSGQGC